MLPIASFGSLFDKHDVEEISTMNGKYVLYTNIVIGLFNNEQAIVDKLGRLDKFALGC